MPTHEQVEQKIESLLDRNAEPSEDQDYIEMVRQVVVASAAENNMDIDAATEEQLEDLLTRVTVFIEEVLPGVFGVRVEADIAARISNDANVDAQTISLRTDDEFREQYFQDYVRQKIQQFEEINRQIADTFIRQTRASLMGGISAPPKNPRNRNRLA